MLELGKSGSHGVPKGVVPVLTGTTVVATLRASNWKESATAVVGDRTWVFGRQRRTLVARWEADPADTARLRAWQTSAWKGSWALDLDGVPVELVRTSWWRGTHRFVAAGRTVAQTVPAGNWSPRLRLEAEPEVSLAGQVFLLWFESVLSRRNTAIAAGAAGAAVAGGAS